MAEPEFAEAAVKETIRRPNGRWLLVLGWIALIAGLIAWSIGGTLGAEDYLGRPDPEKIARRLWIGALGSHLFWAGLALLATGTIVRALWFLTGDEEKPFERFF